MDNAQLRPETAERRWSPYIVGTVAAAVQCGDRDALDTMFGCLSDSSKAGLVRDVNRYLKGYGQQTGRWRPWVEAQWLLPRVWEREAVQQAQNIFASRTRTLSPTTPKTKKDGRRSEIAKVALRLLRGTLGLADTVKRVRALNATYADPLPDNVVDETLIWAAKRIAEKSHGG